MRKSLPKLDFRAFYERFNAPITALDCGRKCAPHNPNGKPFCCDICHAVPAAYQQEWDYLQRSTDLWHIWRGDECSEDTSGADELRAATPDSMRLLACQGPDRCQRNFRALSCRQFPFFPYLSSEYALIGIAYEWSFEPTCWVISNLGAVTEAYRRSFIETFDNLFEQWPEEMDNYAALSEEMRANFAAQNRRIPLLHRNGGYYLISPASERLRRVDPGKLQRFGPYRQDEGAI